MQQPSPSYGLLGIDDVLEIGQLVLPVCYPPQILDDDSEIVVCYPPQISNDGAQIVVCYPPQMPEVAEFGDTEIEICYPPQMSDDEAQIVVCYPPQMPEVAEFDDAEIVVCYPPQIIDGESETVVCYPPETLVILEDDIANESLNDDLVFGAYATTGNSTIYFNDDGTTESVVHPLGSNFDELNGFDSVGVLLEDEHIFAELDMPVVSDYDWF